MKQELIKPILIGWVGLFFVYFCYMGFVKVTEVVESRNVNFLSPLIALCTASFSFIWYLVMRKAYKLDREVLSPQVHEITDLTHRPEQARAFRPGTAIVKPAIQSRNKVDSFRFEYHERSIKILGLKHDGATCFYLEKGVEMAILPQAQIVPMGERNFGSIEETMRMMFQLSTDEIDPEMFVSDVDKPLPYPEGRSKKQLKRALRA